MGFVYGGAGPSDQHGRNAGSSMKEDFGTTLIRKVRAEPELIDITSFGDVAPRYLEKWRGWIVECWSDWEWEE
jgi:hypothetical protein